MTQTLYEIIEQRIDDLHETYYPPYTLTQTFTCQEEAQAYVNQLRKQQPKGPIYCCYEIKRRNR